MGHYMLEILLGKKLVLQPSRVPSFDKQAITRVFDAKGQKSYFENRKLAQPSD